MLQPGGLTSWPKNRIGRYLEALSPRHYEYSLIGALTMPEILCRRLNLCRLKTAIPFLTLCGAYSPTHSK